MDFMTSLIKAEERLLMYWTTEDKLPCGSLYAFSNLFGKLAAEATKNGLGLSVIDFADICPIDCYKQRHGWHRK